MKLKTKNKKEEGIISNRPNFSENRGWGKGQDKVHVNRRIRASKVRLVDDEGNQVGIVDINVALQKAADKGLDLVEVASNTTPPVCRIMDYSKYKYEQKKKQKLAKKKQHVTHVKEVRFKPTIEEHDYQVKIRHIKEFLSHKDKVRISLHFRGRENAHKEFGLELLNRITADLAALGEPESQPKTLGRTIIVTVVPKS